MKKISRQLKRLSIQGKLSLLVILSLTSLALLSNYLIPHPYNLPSGPPLASPSIKHLLGTDDLGIDLLAQLGAGAKISLIIGFSAALLSGLLGGILGILSGYYGGITDQIIMRITDLMIVLPELPMMIVLGAFFGPSLKNIIILNCNIKLAT